MYLFRWPYGSHWQEPVNPFAAKREALLKIMAQGKHSNLAALTNLIPGMKPASTVPTIFHQVRDYSQQQSTKYNMSASSIGFEPAAKVSSASTEEATAIRRAT